MEGYGLGRCNLEPANEDVEPLRRLLVEVRLDKEEGGEGVIGGDASNELWSSASALISVSPCMK